jgi:DNA-binding NtrC family response regulator
VIGYQRLGESETCRLAGKIISATNRDLAAEMEIGRFRKDFFYRLCSDRITTPSLAEQLKDRPDDLELMVGYIAARLPGTGATFVDLCIRGIRRALGVDYPWPGNFRELEQCVRSHLIRGQYEPAVEGVIPGGDWNRLLESASVTMATLLRRYTLHAYEVCGRNVAATARRLDVDRRTVLARLGE